MPDQSPKTVLVMRACDVNLQDLAHPAQFKLVQLKGNFHIWLPLERQINKHIYASHVILYTSPKGYQVMKDYDGNFFDGKRISREMAIETFGHHRWVHWKLPRKVKKEHKKYAAITVANGWT